MVESAFRGFYGIPVRYTTDNATLMFCLSLTCVVIKLYAHDVFIVAERVLISLEYILISQYAENTLLADTGMLDVNNMVIAEEALEHDEDDGNKLEPFNLEQERQEGHFDESGNYVENREEDDPTLQDAWLTSDDGKNILPSYYFLLLVSCCVCWY